MSAMRNDELFIIGRPQPICIGTGLIALDVVLSEKSPPRVWAGGSCGNVLTILSYLGWSTYPIARLGNDPAAAVLLADMERWRVKTDLIIQDESSSTPVIVEKIGVKKNGIPRHWFEWACPHCGSSLPKYRPFPANIVSTVNERIPASQAYYFDRVSPSSIALAEEASRRGALIVFEPSGIKDERLFQQGLGLADIVKYSDDRLKDLRGFTFNNGLEVVTSNSAGTRYRVLRRGKTVAHWRSKPAFEVKNFMDAAGAGDWCSAGLIYLLGRGGKRGFERASSKDIDEAINFGQALAALKCYYEGARGNMYYLSKLKFKKYVHEIMSLAMPTTPVRPLKGAISPQLLYCGSPNCKEAVATVTYVG